MVNKHVNFFIKEKQNHNSYHYTLTGITKIKKTVSRVGKNGEQPERSVTVCENVYRYVHFAKLSGNIYESSTCL